MSTSLIAMGVAAFLVINLVVGLAALSLLFGTFETLFGKPKLTLLRSSKSGNMFAFGFKWNSAKEPAALDTIRLRLFNPFGNPTQVEVSKPFDPKSTSFAVEVDMGPGFIELLGAKGFDHAMVQVEVSSTRDGVVFQFDMKGPKFKTLIFDASQTVAEYVAQNKLDVSNTLSDSDSEIEYVPTSKIKKSKFFAQYGSEVTDYVKAKRDALAPDDIFFLPPGKNTAVATILNPRGMRDLSLALVPASELMQGPKFSEHMKHAVNEVARELKLDAVLVMMNEISWTASHIDKHSGEIIPEQVKIKINASTLISLSQYHQRLQTLGETRDLPNLTVAFRAYEGELKIPVLLSVSEEEQTFNHIEEELLGPTLKGYKDLSQMVLMRIVEDIESTQN